MSLLDSERSLLGSVHDLFAFISSLGHNGFLGSSHDKIPASVKSSYKDINYGYSFFTVVAGARKKMNRQEFIKLKSKLLDSVARFSASVWVSIKKDLSDYNKYYIDFKSLLGKSFSQKLDFLKTIFHSENYLVNLEFSDIEGFEGGFDLLNNKESEDNQPMDYSEDATKLAMANISNEIIPKLEELLYERTRFKSELPTEELLLENMFEFIPIFFNNLIEAEIMTGNAERLNHLIIALAKDLRHFFDYNDDKYYSSVVLIYEQLIKVLDDKIEIFSLFQAKESLIIKKMMSKLTQST